MAMALLDESLSITSRLGVRPFIVRLALSQQIPRE
jgi:hypothetical protein